MPKIKSNSGARKRFKITASGRFKRASANKRHLLTHKSAKRKHHLSGKTMVADVDQRSIARQLPYL
jgi:large subunit ribosomal protein L35